MFIQTSGPLAACLLNDCVLKKLFVENLGAPWSSGAWGLGPNGPVVNPPLTIRRDGIRSYFNSKCSTGVKNADFWPTIKPFLTNKGSKCDSTIMIRVADKIIIDARQVSQHMNECYVNIASSIGENINVSQKTGTNVDFVSMCSNHFDKHPSIVDINNNMHTTAFSFRHTMAATVETILRGLNVKKGHRPGPDSIKASETGSGIAQPPSRQHF